jgi:hypothetical protein
MLGRETLSAIGNVYDKYNKERYPNATLELEARFGYFIDKTLEDGTRVKQFKSTNYYSYYERLLKALCSHELFQPEIIEESTVSTDENNIRRITTTKDGLHTTIWQKKEQYSPSIDLHQYDVRISMNKEIEVEPVDNFKPTNTRMRTRRTFYSVDNLVKVDMTDVVRLTGLTPSRGATSTMFKHTYEVEVEFLGQSAQRQAFRDYVELIFKLLKGTHFIYTNLDKRNLNNDIGNILNNYYTIDKNVLVEARNMKKHDFTYGHIVGNPETTYMITFKADGLRKMLIIHRTGVWLVFPPREYNLVLIPTTNKAFNDFLKNYSGTVLDGELVIPIKEINAYYLYLAFDCLAFSRKPKDKYIVDNVIQISDYKRRRLAANAIVRQLGSLSSKIIQTEMKETAEIVTVDDFFRLTNDFLDRRLTLNYVEDGLIFTPTNIPYNPFNQDVMTKYKKEIIKSFGHEIRKPYPPVFKWKRPEDITIDFALNWIKTSTGLPDKDLAKRAAAPCNADISTLVPTTVNSERQLQLLSHTQITDPKNPNKRLDVMVPFTGTKTNPLTADMIDHLNPLTWNEASETVVEYEWIWLDEQKNKGIFRPRKIRRDKSGPNRLAVATDNWKDIMSPITEDDIRGKSLNMVYYHNNEIKRKLYDEMVSNSTASAQYRNGTTHTLLDIGSGRGGDVSKWTDLSAIVAVEPNSSNRAELERRIKVYGVQDKVLVVPTGGEDTIAITRAVESFIKERKVTDIALMLSLSFFWSSHAHLDALVNTIVHTIGPSGKIYFLTINGDTVLDLFEEEGKNDITIAQANLHLYPEEGGIQALDFYLPDTIVGEQREYIVHIDELTQRLQKHGFQLDYLRPALEGPVLLSPSNQRFASLYSYGRYSLKDNKKLNPGPLVNIPLPRVEDKTDAKVQIQDVIPEPIKIMDDKPLNILPVSYSYRGLIREGPALGDDVTEPLNCSWYNNLVRIACIGEGSCFIHALLKAFYKGYQENNEAIYRVNYAQKVRRDLAQYLDVENPRYPGFIYWESTAGGSYPRLVMQEIQNEELIAELGIDYSLDGLQALLNSSNFLGEEIYAFISEIFNLDVYILEGKVDDLHPHTYIQQKSATEAVVIMGNNIHFEVVAVDTGVYLQTVFLKDDPFVAALHVLFKGIESIKSLTYNPDDAFNTNLIEIFGTRDFEIKIPSIIWERLEAIDPFIIALNKSVDYFESLGYDIEIVSYN